MTKQEWNDRQRTDDQLIGLGFTLEECSALRRISQTLRRWHERECGDGYGCIERDDTTGRPYYRSALEENRRWRIPDLETEARARLDVIMSGAHLPIPAGARRRSLRAYVQTDPRGCALYILRDGDVPDGANPDACYTRGIAVY